MSSINIIINDREVQAEAGATILEAALQNGIKIPTLCNDPRLKPTAACRICLVELQGARNPLPACATPVAEGMVISTATEDLFKTRRMALELMLSDHYGDCIAPCKLTCPAGIDIQGYIALIANGMYVEALQLIMESAPLPSILGRVCPRFCEKQCRRNNVDSPLAINALKRFVSDYAQLHDIKLTPEIKPHTGFKVAVVGGGPSGLSAAYYLALEGHAVSIFDSAPELGGMMRYGIPAYRLPRDILDKDISYITSLCSKVRCNYTFGIDFDLESLGTDGYNAVFMAIGAHANQPLNIEGEDLAGVSSGIGFLRDVAMGNKIKLGNKIAVIGGGNAAMDAAQTAVRMGAGEVTIFYRRTRDEMPAIAEEIKQTEDKGVKLSFLVAPQKIKGDDCHVHSLELLRMELGEPDSSGRRRPVPVPGSEYTVEIDNVIVAIGQSLKAPLNDRMGGIGFDRRGYIGVNKETMQTNLSHVFAGGDCSSGPATVIEAIAAGKRAAHSINLYLSGGPVAPADIPYNSSKGSLSEIDPSEYADVRHMPRTEMPTLDPALKSGFDEYELGFSEDMAHSEAGRCLSCGCLKSFDCDLRDLGTEYKIDSNKYTGLRHKLSINNRDHPYVMMEYNKCILCGKCIRICSEVAGLGVLGFVNRGFETRVEPALGEHIYQTNCNSCGLCLTTCPTGALIGVPDLSKPGPWKLDTCTTVCPECGIGCTLELDTKGDKLIKVSSPLDAPVNNGNLCDRGMFTQLYFNKSRRLRTPTILRNGEPVEASWDEALKAASLGLQQIKASGGADKLAVLVAPTLTNENAYIAQKFARAVLDTNNIGSLAVPSINTPFIKYLGKDRTTSGAGDLANADLILVYNCDLEQRYPVVGYKVRDAVLHDTKLITFNSRQRAIDFMANINLRINKRTSQDVLNSMLSYILNNSMIDRQFVNSNVPPFDKIVADIKTHPPEKIADIPWVNPVKLIEAIQLYVSARNPVIIVDGDNLTPAESSAIGQLLLITGRKGAGLIVLHFGANSQGLLDMGIEPHHLPGQVSIKDENTRNLLSSLWLRPIPVTTGLGAMDIVQCIEKGAINAALLIGRGSAGAYENSILGCPIFKISIDTVTLEQPPYPDVTLPAAVPSESCGTYTNFEGRVQHLTPALPLEGSRETWDILSAMSRILGYDMQYASASDIMNEIMKIVPSYKSVNGLTRDMLPQPEMFATDMSGE